MYEPIPLSIPHIDGNEWDYIKKCLDTGWVSSAGEFVTRFENDICQYTGSQFAVACVNGTAALHISLLLAGVKPDDEVIVPTLTFIAPVNVVRYCQANPVFMDVDEFYNMDSEKTIEFIQKETVFKDGFSFNKSTEKCIRALIPVHVFGNAVRLDDLYSLCQERNIRIIEDATESLGTYYCQDPFSDKHTGTIGDMGCLSFNGNKIITTGGGGMLLTDNEAYADKARYLTTQAKDDSVLYIHHEIGYNYRMNNIQSAIGVAQLEKLPDYIQIKKNNYQLFKEKIDHLKGLHLADVPNYAQQNYWFYALQIDANAYGKTRDELMANLSASKIQTRPVWHLNHLQNPYKNCQRYKIENAHTLLEKTLNIPCSTNLTKKDINQIMDVLLK